MRRTGTIVAFTDDDVVVDRRWLRALTDPFRADPTVGCVTGMIMPAELETPSQAWIESWAGFGKGLVRRRYEDRAGPSGDPLFPFAAGAFGSGANMAFRLDVLRSIGGFDPALGAGTPARGGDDLATFFDVIAAGHAIVYEPAAVVFHADRPDYASLRRQAFGYGVGMGAYAAHVLRTHPRRALGATSRWAPRPGTTSPPIRRRTGAVRPTSPRARLARAGGTPRRPVAVPAQPAGARQLGHSRRTAARHNVGVPDNDVSPLAGAEVHYLHSEHVGDEFKIFVGHCGTAGDGTGVAPPVLYVTDANGLFAGAVEMVRFMQLSAHLPPMLVVGVGYRVGGIDETVVLRTRDFTPTYDAGFVDIFPTQTAMGGADAFRGFFRDELQPWVRERFRVDPDDSAYFGHSQGGLFGTYVLLTEPSIFRRYVLGSPSLWWDRDMMFDVEARYASTHDDLPRRCSSRSASTRTTTAGSARRAASRPASGSRPACGSSTWSPTRNG